MLSLDSQEQQVCLIRELLTDNNMFGGLSEKERQSLAFLSQSNINPNPLPSTHKRLSAVHEKSADILSASDLSFDRTDEELDVSYLRGGKKWKRCKVNSLSSLWIILRIVVEKVK